MKLSGEGRCHVLLKDFGDTIALCHLEPLLFDKLHDGTVWGIFDFEGERVTAEWSKDANGFVADVTPELYAKLVRSRRYELLDPVRGAEKAEALAGRA